MNAACRILTLVTLRIATIACFLLTIPAMFVGMMQSDSGVRSASVVAIAIAIVSAPPLAGCILLWATSWLERNRKAYVYAAPVTIAAWVALAIYLGPAGFKTIGKLILFWVHRLH